MPALNFQARFADLVESGEKRQTIRALRKDGRDPKPGDTLYLYTGMRTKACRKLLEAECRSARPVTILDVGVCLGDDLPRRAERESLARADGFDTESEMVRWFQKTHGLPFKGLLIRW